MQTQVNNKSFEGQNFFVGIDHHLKSWKVTILGDQYEHKSMSQDPDPEILAKYLKRNFPGGEYHAVYEAGFGGFTAARKLNELGINCILIHPADVPTTQKEKINKTDKIDSRKLARMLRGHEFTSIHIPAPELEADRALVRQRFKVMKDVSRTKNRIRSLLYQFGVEIPKRFTDSQKRHWSRIYINWLKELKTEHESLRKTLDNYLRIGELMRNELLILNRQVRELSKKEVYRHNYELLIHIPGIGLITAMTFLAELGDIHRFKTLDALCSFVGLIPSMHSSGDKVQPGRITKRGRKILKVLLVEAAWEAIRKDPALMSKFNHLSSRMKKNKAIIRVSRMLLSRIRYVLKYQEVYQLGVLD